MKNVLITGASGGMGYAVAKLLSEKGYNVFGVDIAATNNLPITYFRADLRNLSEIEQVFQAVSEKVDNLNAIFHFAGFYTMNSLVEISEEQFVKIFDINLFSVYRVNKTFLPLMRSGGKIVITSSELAPLQPLPFTGLYAVTKSAIEKYAYSLRMEVNLLGLNVSVIRPGAVQTGMINASLVSLERLCNETKLYRYNTHRFKKIVDSVETKSVPPTKIAKIAEKILKAKRPKYVYNLNRNPLLRLLNILPQHWQVGIIKGILKKRGKQAEQTR